MAALPPDLPDARWMTTDGYSDPVVSATSFALLHAAEGPQPLAERLAEAAPNTWVNIDEGATGGRNSPMLFCDPHREGIFLVGGTPGSAYGQAKRHFEVEFFDPASGTWSNVSPPGAPWKNASGFTDAPAVGREASAGRSGCG